MLRKSLISIILLLLLWELLTVAFHVPQYIFPSPQDIALTFSTSWKNIFYQASITLIETLLGLFFGTLSGMFVAFLLMMVRPLKLFLLPLMLISQALPTFAIAPLLVLWLGFGMASKICVVMLMTFFPIASAFFDGLNKTPSSYLEMASYMRGKKINIFYYIYFPYALPFLASGLRVSAVFAPMGAVISEWVGASQGLGYLMVNANARVETSMVFAAIFLLVIMALALYFLIDITSKRWIKWS